LPHHNSSNKKINGSLFYKKCPNTSTWPICSVFFDFSCLILLHNMWIIFYQHELVWLMTFLNEQASSTFFTMWFTVYHCMIHLATCRGVGNFIVCLSSVKMLQFNLVNVNAIYYILCSCLAFVVIETILANFEHKVHTKVDVFLVRFPFQYIY
jgi:hypothetical protein